MTPDKDAEIARLRTEYDKRLEEYAAENARLRNRIKGEYLSYLDEHKYKDETARLRRELEYAIEAARENGAERDELSIRLGEMEALRDRLRELTRKAIAVVPWVKDYAEDQPACAEFIAALASGNGDGGK